MKILVTGAAGFIGSNLAEYLLDLGHNVIAIDNFNDYYNPKIKRYNIKDYSNNPNYKLHEIDILNKKELEKVFENEQPQAIIHLAAWAGVTRSFDQPIEYIQNNEIGTINIIDLAIKYDVQNFIFASTSSIYGLDNPTPYTEDMNTDHPLAPYPATKKASEVMLSTYSRNKGLNVSILRIFNPIGKRVRPDLALGILIRSCLYDDVVFKQYWSDPTKTARDYTYVNHIFEAIVKILEKPYKFEIFNMGNSQPITLKELIETVETVVGKAPKIQIMDKRPGEMITTYADISKAQQMLGYNPTTTIQESIKIYYDWFLEQDEQYKKLEL